MLKTKFNNNSIELKFSVTTILRYFSTVIEIAAESIHLYFSAIAMAGNVYNANNVQFKLQGGTNEHRK